MKQERIKNTVTINGKRYVCRVYYLADSGIDRYTIAYRGYNIPGYGYNYPYRVSADYTCGAGRYCESTEFLTGKHLGKRVSFESLPDSLRKAVIHDLTGKR